MKTIAFLAALSLVSFAPVQGVEPKSGGSVEIEKTDVVDSGTYKGTAHKVDPEEKEIYFKTDDGKLLELYLKDKTNLTKEGKAVEFDELKEGQKLEVQVEKKGDKLNPLSVKIME
jgi:hypothetical protein